MVMRGKHCGKPICICTHTDGCDAGWITSDYWVDRDGVRCEEFDNIQKTKHTGAVPCKTCDYDRWYIWNTSTTTEQYHERLRARGTHTRIKAYEAEESSRTRIL